MGSIVTGVSSQFDLATADLGKYRSLVENLKNAAIQLDLSLDELPPGHPHKTNARYSREMLNKDVDNEDSHLSKLEEVLREHHELQLRLDEVNDFQFQFDGDPSDTQNVLETAGATSPPVTARTSPPPMTTTATTQQLPAEFWHLPWSSPCAKGREDWLKNQAANDLRDQESQVRLPHVPGGVNGRKRSQSENQSSVRFGSGELGDGGEDT